MHTRTITTPCVGTVLPAALLQEMTPSWLADYQQAIEPEHHKNVDVQLHVILLFDLTFTLST